MYSYTCPLTNRAPAMYVRTNHSRRPHVHRPCSRVQIFHHRSARVVGWNRSAAKTPIWHQTELSTRFSVFTAAYGTSSFAVSVVQRSGRTDRMVKYIAKRPAKNINSLDSHTMVPTCTMLGRFTPTCACGVSAREAVATGAIIALRGQVRSGGRSGRVAWCGAGGGGAPARATGTIAATPHGVLSRHRSS